MHTPTSNQHAIAEAKIVNQVLLDATRAGDTAQIAHYTSRLNALFAESSAQLVQVPPAMTAQDCPVCEEPHPVSEGIMVVHRSFKCPDCGTYWEDTYCCDCDDDCPECGTTCTSLEILSEEVIVEPVPL